MQVKQGTYKGSGGAALLLAQSEAGASPRQRSLGACPRPRAGRTEGCGPAPAQAAPAGSLPHAGAFLRLGGAGAWSQRVSPAPKPERLQQTEKPRRETRILLPPAWGGERAPRALPRVSRASPRSAKDTQSPSPLRSLASPSPALQATRGEGEQPGGWRRLPCAWAGMSVPHRVDCRSGSTMVSRSGDSM